MDNEDYYQDLEYEDEEYQQEYHQNNKIDDYNQDNHSDDLQLIDLTHLDLNGDQTWLLSPANSTESLHIEKWQEELQRYQENANSEENGEFSDENGSYKQKFDSRTYTRPKKNLRPSLQTIMNNSNGHLQGMKTFTRYKSPCSSINTNTITKYHRSPDMLAEMSELSEMKHRLDETYGLDSGDLSDDQENNIVANSTFTTSKPININLAEPAHNLHNTFNKFLGSTINRHESLANMSPPSLVSSIAMDGSGAFNSATFSRQGSICSQRSVIKNTEEPDDDQTAHNSLSASMTNSILDEKEMNTSILSQFPDNDSLIGSLPPSMVNSVDLDHIKYNNISNPKLFSKRESMESSLVNSGTFSAMFDSVEENLPNGKPKFQIRKSFLQVEPKENLDQFLAFKSNCSTDDLRGLSTELIRAQKLAEKSKEDSFLLNEGMSDSFLKDTGRESLNMTYNKLPKYQPLQRTLQRPTVNDFDPKLLLPNQTSSPINGSQNNVSNGNSEENKNNPKRNFRKSNPTRNLTTVISSGDATFENHVDIDILDSNKKDYDVNEDDRKYSEYETFQILPKDDIKISPSNSTMKNDEVRKSLSSDSLDQTSSSCTPPRVEPIINLELHDLEQRAYEQQQRLYQIASTPISRLPRNEPGSANILFQQNTISPIHNRKDSLSSSTSSNKSESYSEGSQYRTIKLNSSSLGNLTRNAGDVSRISKIQSSVKRESSAPEIVSNQHYLQVNRMSYNRKPALSQNTSPAKRIIPSHENGIRSVGGSPMKHSNLRKPNELQKTQQFSGSNNELTNRRSGLPTSKLRQYSSHKELDRIPGPTRWPGSGAGLGALRPSSRNSLHASNPSLYAAPLIRQTSYTLLPKDGVSAMIQRRDFVKASRKEVTGVDVSYKPTNHLTNTTYGQPLKAKHNITNLLPQPNRTSLSNMNIQANKQITTTRQSTTNTQSRLPNPPAQSAPATQCLPRPSGLPRPSSGIPRKPGLRPPSTYTLAPRQTDQTSDCY